MILYTKTLVTFLCHINLTSSSQKYIFQWPWFCIDTNFNKEYNTTKYFFSHWHWINENKLYDL